MFFYYEVSHLLKATSRERESGRPSWDIIYIVRVRLDTLTYYGNVKKEKQNVWPFVSPKEHVRGTLIPVYARWDGHPGLRRLDYTPVNPSLMAPGEKTEI